MRAQSVAPCPPDKPWQGNAMGVTLCVQSPTTKARGRQRWLAGGEFLYFMVEWRMRARCADAIPKGEFMGAFTAQALFYPR